MFKRVCIIKSVLKKIEKPENNKICSDFLTVLPTHH